MNSAKRFFASLPRVTKALLVANFVVWLMQLVANAELVRLFALWPLPFGAVSDGVPTFLPWQIVSYAFLHGGFAHMFFNMFAVLMFGAQLEYDWGPQRFARFWFACIVGAAVCQLAVITWVSPSYSVGASGGVYGLIIAFAMKYPDQRITMLPLPIPIRARTMAIGYALAAVVYGVLGSRDGVAHFAHLGGMLTGWLLIRYWRQEPPFGKGKKKLPKLRIVH